MDTLQRLDDIANELIAAFDIKATPVPVETMLRQPRDGMWDEVNISQLTGSFLSFKDPYAPRMSMARLLAKHVIHCTWGREREVGALIAGEEDTLRAFARMIVMPRELIEDVNRHARNPVAISMQFEVPESDAQMRLLQLYGSD